MRKLTIAIGVILAGLGCREELAQPIAAIAGWLTWLWHSGHLETAAGFALTAWNTTIGIVKQGSTATGIDPLLLSGAVVLGTTLFGRRGVGALWRMVVKWNEPRIGPVVQEALRLLGDPAYKWERGGEYVACDVAKVSITSGNLEVISPVTTNAQCHLSNAERRALKRAASTVWGLLELKELSERESRLLAAIRKDYPEEDKSAGPYKVGLGGECIRILGPGVPIPPNSLSIGAHEPLTDPRKPVEFKKKK